MRATALLPNSRMPRGWPVSYKDAHVALQRACDKIGGSRDAYNACLKRYKLAVSTHLKADSAMAENPDPEDGAVVVADDSKYNDRFRNKELGKMPLYFSTAYTFTRPARRRRTHGGGRHRNAAIIRELLIDWYSRIRHSVDCRLMRRVPGSCSSRRLKCSTRTIAINAWRVECNRTGSI